MHEHAKSEYVRVRVKTSAKRDTLHRADNGVWQVSVREAARNGQANERVRELLAHALEVPPQKLRLIHGGTKPSKLFLLT